MDLNLFENLKKDIESNVNIQNFMEEVSDFLSDISSSLTHEKYARIVKNNIPETKKILSNINNENRKEGHLYFVTEDRNNEVYLWDFTDKPEHEFKETISSEQLLNVAKEGAMLQYKNGKYSLYSPDGYDMVFNEKFDT